MGSVSLGLECAFWHLVAANMIVHLLNDCLFSLKISQVISLMFSTFFTEYFADFVQLYDGNSTSAPLLANLSGSWSSVSYTSSQRYMLVTFKSNENRTYGGFNATFSSIILPGNVM